MHSRNMHTRARAQGGEGHSSLPVSPASAHAGISMMRATTVGGTLACPLHHSTATRATQASHIAAGQKGLTCLQSRGEGRLALVLPPCVQVVLALVAVSQAASFSSRCIRAPKSMKRPLELSAPSEWTRPCELEAQLTATCALPLADVVEVVQREAIAQAGARGGVLRAGGLLAITGALAGVCSSVRVCQGEAAVSADHPPVVYAYTLADDGHVDEAADEDGSLVAFSQWTLPCAEFQVRSAWRTPPRIHPALRACGNRSSSMTTSRMRCSTTHRRPWCLPTWASTQMWCRVIVFCCCTGRRAQARPPFSKGWRKRLPFASGRATPRANLLRSTRTLSFPRWAWER